MLSSKCPFQKCSSWSHGAQARTSRPAWWGPIRTFQSGKWLCWKNEWAIPSSMLLNETQRAKMLSGILKRNWGVRPRANIFSKYILNSEMGHKKSPLNLCYWKTSFWGFNFCSMIANANKVTLESYSIIYVLVKAEGKFLIQKMQKLVLIIWRESIF